MIIPLCQVILEVQHHLLARDRLVFQDHLVFHHHQVDQAHLSNHQVLVHLFVV